MTQNQPTATPAPHFPFAQCGPIAHDQRQTAWGMDDQRRRLSALRHRAPPFAAITCSQKPPLSEAKWRMRLHKKRDAGRSSARPISSNAMADAVIFDMDGVLVDSYDAHFRSWRLLGEETGVAFDEEHFAETFGRTSQEIIRRFWSGDLSEQRGAVPADYRRRLSRNARRRRVDRFASHRRLRAGGRLVGPA